MAYSIVNKQLIVSKLLSRCVVPFRPALAINRRGIATNILHNTILDKLERIHHTFFLSASLNASGDLENLKFTANFPGSQKWKVTNEGVCTFIDMGLGGRDDYGVRSYIGKQLKLEGKDLFFEARVGNKNLRNFCHGTIKIPLTDNIDLLNSNVDRKDGGLLITFPKVDASKDICIVPSPQRLTINQYDRVLQRKIQKAGYILGRLSVNYFSEPHTICASGTHEDLGHLEKLDRILKDFLPLGNLKKAEDLGRLENLLDTMGYFDNLKISVSIPGNEKWEETDQRIWTFVDMGLEHWDNYKEASVKTRLKNGNKLFIKINAKNKEFGRSCVSRSWIQLPVDKGNNICKSYKIDKRDGGLVIYLPKGNRTC